MAYYRSIQLCGVTDVDTRRICITANVGLRRNMRMGLSMDRVMSWRTYVVFEVILDVPTTRSWNPLDLSRV